jgi:uncharacterized protein (TIGR02452 family)
MEEDKQSRHTEAALRIDKRSNKDKRAWRISIYEKTKQIAAVGCYRNYAGETVFLPSMPADESVQVIYSELPEIERRHETRVTVFEGDCVEVGIRLQELGFNVAVLNMASSYKPGGGVKNGSGAQEENLFRRSNYHLHLGNRERVRYPVAPTEGIYSPNVVFFRASEADNYELLAVPKVLNMVAVPALSHPKLVKSGSEYWLKEEELEVAKGKIRIMLKLAASKGCDAMVLSAWGCGAYENPPLCIATAFRAVMEEAELANYFQRVVFAIFDDQNARKAHNPQGNLVPFAQVFQCPVLHSLSELA